MVYAASPDTALPIPSFSEEQLAADWPQASGELLGLAYHMRRHSGLKNIADNIYMAIQMADKAFKDQQDVRSHG